MEDNRKHFKLWTVATCLIVLFAAIVLIMEKGVLWKRKGGKQDDRKNDIVVSQKDGSSKIILVEPIEDIDVLEKQIMSLFDSYITSHFNRTFSEYSFSDDGIDQEIEGIEEMQKKFLDNFMKFRKELDNIFDNFVITHKPFSLTSKIVGDWKKADTALPVQISEDGSNYLYTIDVGDVDTGKISLSIEGRVMNFSIFDDKHSKRTSFNNSKITDNVSSVDLKILLSPNADVTNARATFKEGKLIITVPKLANDITVKVPIQ